MKPTLKLRPSEAHRWTRCTASPRLIAENIDRIPVDSSVYADEGTLAHELAAEALVLGYDRAAFGDNDEMAENVLSYVSYVLGHKTGDEDLFVEQKIETYYHPGQTGYVDALVAADDGFSVIDLKYGAGVSVAAEENEQLLVYALSALAKLEKAGYKYPAKAKIKMAIFQPRVRGEDSEREWLMTLAELKKRGEALEAAAKKILSGDPGVFAPSESACRWCGAKPFCGKYAELMLADVPAGRKLLQPKGMVPPSPETLDDEKIGRLLRRLPEIVKWAGSVKDHVEGRLKRGERVDGFKLVASKPNRKWGDQSLVEDYLLEHLEEEEVFSRSIISPAQAETLLKRRKVPDYLAEVEKLAVRPEGGPTLAFAEDKRPEWRPVDAGEEFEPLDDEKPKTKNRKKK